MYGMRKYGRKRYGSRYGGRRKMVAKMASRRAYRKAIRMPKRIIAKKFANAVGQIAYKSGRSRPSHRRY